MLEQFAKYVRSALRQLYDAPSLATHPLADLLADEESGALDRAQHLRRLLLDAIHACRPPAAVPADSPDWRAYRILEMRYIEGLSTAEAMAELALQKSQYFRDQARALRVVTVHLWADYERIRGRASASRVTEADAEATTQENLMLTETERLVAQATWEQVDAGRLLEELRNVVEPLASAKGASVSIDNSSPLHIAHASRVSLRQAILNAVTYGLERGRGGWVEVRTFAEQPDAGICIRARTPGGPRVAEEPYQAQEMRLDICRRLLAPMGGSLHVWPEEGTQWEARLVWHGALPRQLLVIDDNQGFVDLFRRYLTGHDWQVIGVSNVAEARRTIAQTRPTVITLDVLMPQEDGWDVLIALKTSEDTRDIPVIVCSVLNEPQLALSLGATAYLPKPVTERSLLRALVPWSGAIANRGPARPD